MLKDFKEFALKGNVLDMSIGIIIGTAFGKIITSAVNDVLMPPLGLLIGKVDFSNLFFNLSDKSVKSLAEAKTIGAATINYGLFINTLIDFVLVAFALFLIIQQFNRLKKQPAPTTTTKECQQCFSTIPIKALRCPCCTSSL